MGKKTYVRLPWQQQQQQHLQSHPDLRKYGKGSLAPTSFLLLLLPFLPRRPPTICQRRKQKPSFSTRSLPTLYTFLLHSWATLWAVQSPSLYFIYVVAN